jgi:hypothetical protein
MLFERVALPVPSLVVCWLGYRTAGWSGIGVVLASAAVTVSTALFVRAGIGRREAS